ncbi:DUF3060 domain-containing protein [Caulobacter sp.]|jgi:hypothetical protein|uniref:DUF3060 domain-containing protein n=1 Tax=Caulobacter sp. TaxID=78 RepID=UPI00160F292F
MISVTLLALIAGLAGQAKAPIHIAGVGQGNTVACEGRGVIVDGTEHNLTFTGNCASLKLNGTDNKVMIDLAPGAPVVVTGTDQTVRWRSSKAPQVRMNGVDNSVSKAP